MWSGATPARMTGRSCTRRSFTTAEVPAQHPPAWTTWVDKHGRRTCRHGLTCFGSSKAGFCCSLQRHVCWLVAWCLRGVGVCVRRLSSGNLCRTKLHSRSSAVQVDIGLLRQLREQEWKGCNVSVGLDWAASGFTTAAQLAAGEQCGSPVSYQWVPPASRHPVCHVRMPATSAADFRPGPSQRLSQPTVQQGHLCCSSRLPRWRCMPPACSPGCMASEARRSGHVALQRCCQQDCVSLDTHVGRRDRICSSRPGLIGWYRQTEPGRRRAHQACQQPFL